MNAKQIKNIITDCRSYIFTDDPEKKIHIPTKFKKLQNVAIQLGQSIWDDNLSTRSSLSGYQDICILYFRYLAHLPENDLKSVDTSEVYELMLRLSEVFKIELCFIDFYLEADSVRILNVFDKLASFRFDDTLTYAISTIGACSEQKRKDFAGHIIDRMHSHIFDVVDVDSLNQEHICKLFGYVIHDFDAGDIELFKLMAVITQNDFFIACEDDAIDDFKLDNKLHAALGKLVFGDAYTKLLNTCALLTEPGKDTTSYWDSSWLLHNHPITEIKELPEYS